MALTDTQTQNIINSMSSKVIEDIDTMELNDMRMDGMVLTYHYYLNDGQCGVMTRVFGKKHHVDTQEARDAFVRYVVEGVLNVCNGVGEEVDVKRIAGN